MLFECYANNCAGSSDMWYDIKKKGSVNGAIVCSADNYCLICNTFTTPLLLAATISDVPSFQHKALTNRP